MATYYWVGGAGTWSATATTNWASVSGGSGGAGFPTTADDVIFDTSSGTGTVAFSGVCVCRNLTVTATQALTFGSGTFNGIYGSMTLPVGGSFSWTGVPVTFRATTTGNTVNWGDKSTTQSVSFQGVGGEWTLTSNMTVNQLGLYAGTFNAGSYTLNLNSGAALGNGSTFVLNMGSATFNCGGGNPWAFSTTTNFTINAGTSTIVVTQNASAFNGQGYTYYNLTRTNTQGSWTINGANTFNNLTIAATASTTLITAFAANQTINGTLSVSGGSSTARIQFGSSVAGTQRTLSVATIGTLTNTNWKDINLTGASSPWTAPLGVLDLGNNSGITFDTTTLYWIGGSGTWNDSAHWSASSGGSTAGGIPGPTNNVVIDTSSGTGAIDCPTTSSYYCKDLTVTATQSLQVFNAASQILNIYGNLTMPVPASSFTFYWNSTLLTFPAPSSSYNITSNGKGTAGMSFTGGASYTFIGDTIVGSGSIYGYGGLTVSNTATLNTNNVAVLTSNLTVSNTATLNLGSSVVGSVSARPSVSIAATATFNAGTSTIYTASQNFVGGGKTFYNVDYDYYYACTWTGANTFNNLKINGQSIPIYFAADQTVNGTFTATGQSVTSRLRLQSNTFGTQRTISAATVSLTNTDFYGIIGAGAATWTGTNIGNATLNSNITFTSPKTVYWNLAAGGDWTTSVAWATSSGGTPSLNNFPLPQDTAIIENTGLNTSATITTNGYTIFNYPVLLCNVDMSTRTNAANLSFVIGPYFCGNLTYGSGITNVTAAATTFLGSTTLTPAGISWISSITIAAGATLTNSGALTSTSTLTNNGTLTLGANATFTTCALGSASTTNFSTNKILLTGSGGTIFTGSNTQTVTGTPIVEANYSGSVGTRTINCFSPTEANTINFNITSGTDTVSITNLSRSLDFTGFSGSFVNSTRSIFGSLTISSGMTLAAGTAITTFTATSGTKTITTNGKTFDFPITFGGVGGTWQLQDNLTQGSTRLTTLTNGTLDLNGKTYTVGSGLTTATGTKNITFNGGTLVCPAVTATAFNNAQPTNFTTTAGTGTGKISMTGATAKTFVGGGSTYNCTLEQAGAGALTITGSNTFNNITNTTQPVSVLFTAGTTNTFNSFSLSGTSGNLVTIGSVTASSHTLSKSSGVVSVNYCTISYSTATGGASWQSYTTNGNVNGGNNSGWLFAPATAASNGLLFGSNF